LQILLPSAKEQSYMVPVVGADVFGGAETVDFPSAAIPKTVQLLPL
jgi:hypothetical protein